MSAYAIVLSQFSVMAFVALVSFMTQFSMDMKHLVDNSRTYQIDPSSYEQGANP